jgi:hypothetical protein
MKTKQTALLISLIAIGTWSALAQTTISGNALNDLQYLSMTTPPTPGDAYFAPASGGTPALAVLYTPDAGLSPTGDNPGVFVNAPMGNLSAFSASYGLYSASGEATSPGTLPYWIVWVSPPGDNNPNDQIGIIGMGGSSLNGGSTIHVVDSYNNYNNNTPSYWGDSLSTLDTTTYARTGALFGDMTVDSAGVSIGLWDNGMDDNGNWIIIPAGASFDSFTVSADISVPDSASTLFLLGLGFAGLAVFGFRHSRLQVAK